MTSGVERQRAGLDLEQELWETGHCLIAGLDEVGRGAWAGPVVAAAVILPPGVDLPGVNDSKKLTPSRRDKLFDLIHSRAVAVGVGMGDHLLIDRINILQATLQAMRGG